MQKFKKSVGYAPTSPSPIEPNFRVIWNFCKIWSSIVNISVDSDVRILRAIEKSRSNNQGWLPINFETTLLYDVPISLNSWRLCDGFLLMVLLFLSCTEAARWFDRSISAEQKLCVLTRWPCTFTLLAKMFFATHLTVRHSDRVSEANLS